MGWFLLIPAVFTLIAYKIWPHKITIGELLVPVIVSLLAIIISYVTLKSVNMEDVEYNGYLIVKARF
jgi:asparagine N-glycosylation enzyme membrane subunit Stt3